jgi:hypothetical protein
VILKRWKFVLLQASNALFQNLIMIARCHIVLSSRIVPIEIEPLSKIERRNHAIFGV